MARSGECPGEASDRVGVARRDSGPAQRRDRRGRVEEEAEEPGGERLLRDPALAGEVARISLAIGRGQRGVEPVEDRQALIPSRAR